jgi:hypothetical protein
MMAFCRQAATLVPLQLIADVDREVVLVKHLELVILILPVHDVWPSQLAQVEVHAGCPDILAVKCPHC